MRMDFRVDFVFVGVAFSLECYTKIGSTFYFIIYLLAPPQSLYFKIPPTLYYYHQILYLFFN